MKAAKTPQKTPFLYVISVKGNQIMAKFLFVYRNNADQERQPSPEEMQAAMAAWGEWFKELGSAIIDGGDGLLPTGKRVSPDGAVSDGPFIEAKELVGGYSILQADDIDQACELAKGCPILAAGGNVEVRPLAGYSDAL